MGYWVLRSGRKKVDGFLDGLIWDEPITLPTTPEQFS